MFPPCVTSLVAQRIKHLPTMWEARGSIPGRNISWRRKWQPTPISLPGKPHGQRSLVGYSPWGRKELDMTEWPHFHFSFFPPCSVAWGQTVLGIKVTAFKRTDANVHTQLPGMLYSLPLTNNPHLFQRLLDTHKQSSPFSVQELYTRVRFVILFVFNFLLYSVFTVFFLFNF